MNKNEKSELVKSYVGMQSFVYARVIDYGTSKLVWSMIDSTVINALPLHQKVAVRLAIMAASSTISKKIAKAGIEDIQVIGEVLERLTDELFFNDKKN